MNDTNETKEATTEEFSKLGVPALNEGPDDGKVVRRILGIFATVAIAGGAYWFWTITKDKQAEDEQAAVDAVDARKDESYNIARGQINVIQPRTAPVEIPKEEPEEPDPRMVALAKELAMRQQELELRAMELNNQAQAQRSEYEKFRDQLKAEQERARREEERARRAAAAAAERAAANAEADAASVRDKGSEAILVDFTAYAVADQRNPAKTAPPATETVYAPPGGFGNPGGRPAIPGGEQQPDPRPQEEQFADRVYAEKTEDGSVERMTADPCKVMREGDVLTATLDTRIITPSPPAKVVAVLSLPYRAHVGCPELLPAMTRLIGRRNSTTGRGAERIQVAFTRAMNEWTGMDVALDSPGTGMLGEGGLDAVRDTQFFKRFGNTLVLNMIGVGVALAIGDDNNRAAEEAGASFNESATIALQDEVNIPPMLVKEWGEEVQITVERDIDFSGVL